jgi:hypothetical protein
MLDHLLPTAKKTAKLNNSERIKRIQSGYWIGYSRATQALMKLEELLTYPRCKRMPNLLIVGPTNNGKTMIIEKFLRNKSSSGIINSELEQIPIISIQMPPNPDEKKDFIIHYYIN